MTLISYRNLFPEAAITKPDVISGGLDLAPTVPQDGPMQRRKRPDVVLPFIYEEEGLFYEHPNASYFVGVLATEGAVVRPAAYLGARRLRYDTYRGYGLYTDENRALDGGDKPDENADRVTVFGVLKNVDGMPRLIATSQLITNRDGEAVLPVQKVYTDVFSPEGSGAGSSEMGRFVSMSKDRTERKLAAAALQRAGMGWVLNHGITMAYAEVDDKILNQLAGFNIPFTEISGYRYNPAYNSAAKLVAIDAEQALRRATLKSIFFGAGPIACLASTAFFSGTREHQGLGFYGRKMIKRFN